jgi:hypothetical protein
VQISLVEKLPSFLVNYRAEQVRNGGILIGGRSFQQYHPISALKGWLAAPVVHRRPISHDIGHPAQRCVVVAPVDEASGVQSKNIRRGPLRRKHRLSG